MSMVRLGGILSFLLVALVTFSAIAPQQRSVSLVVYAVLMALIAFVLWCTKALFNGRNYRQADVPIVGIIVIVILIWVLTAFGLQIMGAVRASPPSGSALVAVRWIALAVLLLLLICIVWFSFCAIHFGREAVGGGSVWMAVGVLYIVAVALLMITAATFAILGSRGAEAATQMMATGLVGPVFIAGFLMAVWISHGVGLLVGANRMK